MRLSRLLFPALRWEEQSGFGHEAESIERALALGVGGFILFGGEAGAVRELISGIRRKSAVPLLFGADLERGAGQQFRGATPLPPVAALGSLDDLAVTRRAGELTAREARALGVDWVYAPVADLDIEPRNPIVGTRAFGAEPEQVAAQVAAWVEGCRAGGALSCAKHFPGHGRTTSDSHLALPVVAAGRDELEADLTPFQSAVRGGVDSIMTAHVSYPALDPSGVPATLSRRIVTELLREELGFGGLVVTDALIMEGVRGEEGAVSAAVRAVAAGCDVLLYPDDPAAVAAELEGALGGALSEARIAEALGRIEAAARRAEAVRGAGGAEWGREADRSWALDVAMRTIRVVRGEPVPVAGRVVEVLTVDDDLGGPFPPPSRGVFPAILREGGVEVREVVAPAVALGSGAEALVSADTPAATSIAGPLTAGSDTHLIIALYADIRGWKGRPGLSARAVAELERALATRPDALIMLFGHPRLAAEIPGAAAVVAAWGGEVLAQEAAARWLLRQDQAL